MDRRSSRMYPVLSRPRLVAGVEHGLAIANGTLAIVVVMHFRQWTFLPVFVLLHMLMAVASKHEVDIRKVYRRYSIQADCYEPFPRNRGSKIRNPRPHGWGRGVPC